MALHRMAQKNAIAHLNRGILVPSLPEGQILLNLLSNAVKFTPPGGEVLLAVSIDKDGGLLLSVTDTGIGIGKEDLPKVMEPFGQVESALSRRFSGTGLGLSLVRTMYELHGASLALDSKLGRGTTALVSFPVERVVESSPTL